MLSLSSTLFTKQLLFAWRVSAMRGEVYGQQRHSPSTCSHHNRLPLCIGHHKFVSPIFTCLNSNLQAETINIVSAVKEINTVIATLQNVRDNINPYHSEWFSTVDVVGTGPSLPRRCGCQTHRSNIPADSPSQYYNQSLSLYLITYSLRWRHALPLTTKPLCWGCPLCHQLWWPWRV